MGNIKFVLCFLITIPQLYFVLSYDASTIILQFITLLSQISGILFNVFFGYCWYKRYVISTKTMFYCFIALFISNIIFAAAGHIFVYDKIYLNFGLYLSLWIIIAHLIYNYAHVEFLLKYLKRYK